MPGIVSDSNRVVLRDGVVPCAGQGLCFGDRLSLTSCVILKELLTLSVFTSSIKVYPLLRLLGRLNRLIEIRLLGQCLVHSKCSIDVTRPPKAAGPAELRTMEPM